MHVADGETVEREPSTSTSRRRCSSARARRQLGRATRKNAKLTHPVGIIGAMCNRCNGASLDEIRFHLHGLIQRCGWSVQAVTGRPGWAYTVGLAATFDHPEFVVVGLKPETAAYLLNAFGEMTRDGDRFEAGETIVGFEGEELRLVAVHDYHFVKGTFASWVDYYGALGPPYPERRALEVVRPGRRPRLDRCDRFDPRPF